MSGFISPKRAVKLRTDSWIFSGSNRGILSLVRVSFCSALITPGAQINFAAKREKWLSPLSRRSHLFFPLFWLYFNERIYEYGDKVKPLISWKSERLLQIKVLQTVHKYSCKCQLAIRFRHALCSKYYLNKQFEN